MLLTYKPDFLMEEKKRRGANHVIQIYVTESLPIQQ
jgi:hypothetical protein